MEIRERLRKEILVFDGAMGTMLEERGLKLGQLPEILNLEKPQLIREVHESYIEAGAHIITTNTFGANERKLRNSGFSVEEVIGSAVKNAREAIGDRDVAIALDIGPIGELVEPMGNLSFEEAYKIFQRQVKAGLEAGVHLILIETMADLYEMKAAILAAKENSKLPIFATMTFEENKRTFTGTCVESMVLTLEGLGVDALGINCSLGPKEIELILDDIVKIATIPVMVQANAGLPQVKEGKTIYKVDKDEFAQYAKIFIEKGASIIGGCCGSRDDYIKEIVKSIKDMRKLERKPRRLAAVASPSNFLEIKGLRVIGERINPTGKEDFKEALRRNDLDYIIREAISQVEAGAHILDVNLGLAEIDEEKLMVRVVKEIQAVLDTPLQIDSTDPKVIEAALRVYNGKAIVNSVNGDDKDLDSILPIVKKYGASVVGLCLDEKGIPSRAEARFKIAEKIVKRAEDYGIPREDVFIDCLVLTVAAQQEEVLETLKAVKLVKEKLGVKTLLGVSNISFGLPNRQLINKTFLGAALYAGLDMAIINPGDREMMDVILASNLLWNKDKAGQAYIESFEGFKEGEKEKIFEERNLYNLIIRGTREEARSLSQELLKTEDPLDLVNKYIIPALDEVGDRYEKGLIFLPQLIQAAETVQGAFELIREKLTRDKREDLSREKIILATVKGDIHDIGKNIVKVLLENYNYEIIDLGKDVAADRILQVARDEGVKLVGLSALMTSTVKSMEESIRLLRERIPDVKIMVGGAVLDEKYSEMIGADFYGHDAKEAIRIAREILD